jgi:uncharacterized protein YndB with AHSA1/START domain
VSRAGDRWWNREHHVQSGALKEIGIDPEVGGRVWDENDAVGSRVTVTFTPTGSGTQVTLVHDQLDVHGPGWENMRDSVGSDGGWPGLLRGFARAAESLSS